MMYPGSAVSCHFGPSAVAICFKTLRTESTSLESVTLDAARSACGVFFFGAVDSKRSPYGSLLFNSASTSATLTDLRACDILIL